MTGSITQECAGLVGAVLVFIYFVAIVLLDARLTKLSGDGRTEPSPTLLNASPFKNFRALWYLYTTKPGVTRDTAAITLFYICRITFAVALLCFVIAFALGMQRWAENFYDPNLDRFLQTDPVGYEDDLNLYQYVHNDPLNGVDPRGRQTVALGVEEEIVLQKGQTQPPSHGAGVFVNLTDDQITVGTYTTGLAIHAAQRVQKQRIRSLPQHARTRRAHPPANKA